MLRSLASFFVAPAGAARQAVAPPPARGLAGALSSIAVVGRAELSGPVGAAVARMAGSATVVVVDAPRSDEIDAELADQDLVLVVLGADADPVLGDLALRDMPAGPRVVLCPVAVPQALLALARSGIVVGPLRSTLKAALEGRG